METVQTSAQALLGVINDILDFSKIEAGRMDLCETECDVRRIVTQVAKSLSASARNKGIEMLCNIHSEVPSVIWTDPGRLRQVLVNLVGNALKFTDRGEVAIGVTAGLPADNEVVLHFSVRDTGPGIPRDQQKRIFEPFVQADGSMRRAHGGSGLGLAICSRLVGMMGGQLWLESASGQGSTFHFTVRSSRPSLAADSPSEESHAARTAH
jgi:two-component system, sensor histidine kinase and response regulator